MEEIEKLHKNRKHKKSTWVEALGFKKDIMQFLTCLRNLKFRCFGSFPGSDIISDEEEDEEVQEHQVGMEGTEGTGPSRTVFSKWFMVLQENQKNGLRKEERKERGEEESGEATSVPPSNALLLMRCSGLAAGAGVGSFLFSVGKPLRCGSSRIAEVEAIRWGIQLALCRNWKFVIIERIRCHGDPRPPVQ
ncbi:hypothetical protein HHK36_008078 [Tetracentron sinense]|uniref:Uncharacterized protein n=1 Tax=Tetracentron sinense TaxID=13715 RepID=A0A834ZIW5_TETSI|nr:hypothetical protein HHK36_008078 [Tetracentron sinense]